MELEPMLYVHIRMWSPEIADMGIAEIMGDNGGKKSIFLVKLIYDLIYMNINILIYGQRHLKGN